MEDLWQQLKMCGYWLEGGDDDNHLAIQLPLGGALEIRFHPNNTVWKEFSFQVYGRWTFIKDRVPRAGFNLRQEKGYTKWENNYELDDNYYHDFHNLIGRLHEAEIGLRNQAQADAAFYLCVLRRWDQQKPVFQRLTKDITQIMGTIFYDRAIERARESL